MAQIPIDGLANSVAKIDLRLPAQFAFRLAAVDGVTQIVPGPVFDVFDQRLRLAQKVQERQREIDVLDLLVAAEVIDLAFAPLSQGRVDAPTVIENVDPIADIFAFAVNRDRLVLDQVGNEQRNDLFGKLVGTVIVRAARGDRGETERVALRSHQEIGRRLRRRVGAVGRDRRLFGEKACGSEAAVNFVGRNLNVSFDLGLAANVQQYLRPDDVGLDEGAGVENAAIDMTLSGEVHDGIDGAGGDHRIHKLGVADVAPFETVPGIAFDVGQVFEVAGVGQLVDVDDGLIRIAVQLVADEVRADEPAATGDD